MPLSDHNGKDEFEIDFTGFKKRSDSNIYEKLPKQDLIGGFISSNVYFELSGADIDTEAELPFRNLDLSEFINTKKALVFLKVSGEYTEDINDAIIARPAGDENYKVDKVLNNNLIGGIGNSLVDKNGQGNYIICPTNNEGKIEVIAPKGLVKIRLVGYIPKISHIVDILSDHGQPTGIGPHKEGALVNISVAPNPGYNFSSWTVLSGNVSILRNSFIMPAEDVFLRANFSAIKYTVTVTGTNGSPSGSGTYTIEEVVTLSPNPDANYGFVRWEIDPSISISNNKFTMPASDVTVTAIYDAIEYTVTVTAKDNHGNPTGSGSYLPGQQVILDPKPKTGFRFRYWVSSIIITGNQFIMPDSNMTITAVYEEVHSSLVHFSEFAIGRNITAFDTSHSLQLMLGEGEYPDFFDLWINDNPRGADPLIDSANSTIDSIIVRENTLLTIYDEPNFQGNIILQESGPKGFYSHTVSYNGDYSELLDKMDPEKLKETGLLNSDGEIIEDNIKMVNNEALFPTLKGSVKIQDIGTPTVIGSGAKGTIHVEGNRITSYSLTNAGSGYDRSLYESQPGTMSLWIKMEEWHHITSNGSIPPKSDPVDRMQDPRTRGYSIAEFQDGTEGVNHYEGQFSDYSSPNFPVFSAGISDYGQINSINILHGYNFQNTTYDWVRISPAGGVTTYTWVLRTYTFELIQWNIPGKDM